MASRNPDERGPARHSAGAKNAAATGSQTGWLNFATRFSFDSALLGAEMLGGLLRPQTRHRWTRAFDALGHDAAGEMSETSQLVFHAGVELAEEWLGLGMGMASGDHASIEQAARRATDSLRLLRIDERGDNARLEARHKLNVFWQVRQSRQALGTPRDGRPFNIGEPLALALELDGGLDFWALEGLGHDYVLAHLQSAGDCGRSLLDDVLARAPGLTAGHRMALHAGLGLAIHEHLLSGLKPSDPLERFDACLQKALDLCHRHAVDSEQAQVALETLGLITRVFFPPLFENMALAVSARASMRRLFWHGAGRGFYFQGGQLVPGYGTLGRALHRIRAAGEHIADRADAMAGLAYASTLVNRRAPEILASSLLEHALKLNTPRLENVSAQEDAVAEAIVEAESFCSGVAGALIMSRELDGEPAAIALVDAITATLGPEAGHHLVIEPLNALEAQGPRHSLYGALPWHCPSSAIAPRQHQR